MALKLVCPLVTSVPPNGLPLSRERRGETFNSGETIVRRSTVAAACWAAVSDRAVSLTRSRKNPSTFPSEWAWIFEAKIGNRRRVLFEPFSKILVQFTKRFHRKRYSSGLQHRRGVDRLPDHVISLRTGCAKKPSYRHAEMRFCVETAFPAVLCHSPWQSPCRCDAGTPLKSV